LAEAITETDTFAKMGNYALQSLPTKRQKQMKPSGDI
jgi:hypothetical protein